MSSSPYKDSNLGLWIIGVIALLILAGLGYFLYHTKIERAVWFDNLKNGSEVESPFRVDMKAKNLVVEPAANGVTDGRGHFHILVDTSLTDSTLPVPMDARHIHYGKGDSVAFLDLPVGNHTLTLLFAKGDHVPYQPQIMQEIHIRVTRRNASESNPYGGGKPGVGNNGETDYSVPGNGDAGDGRTVPAEGSDGMGVGGGVGVGSSGVGN